MRRSLYPRLILAVSLVALIGLIFQIGTSRAAAPLAFSDALVTCLKEAVGPAAFAEISAGSRLPTASEKTAGENCRNLLPTIDDGVPTPSSTEEPTELTNQLDAATLKVCLESALGADRLRELTTGQGGQPTATERTAGERCFKQYGQPDMAAPDKEPPTQPAAVTTGGAVRTISLPAGMVSCLEEILGTDRFQALMQGGQPTGEERTATQTCFEKFRDEIYVAPSATSSAGPGLDPEKEACVRRIMGSEFDVAQAGGAPSIEKKKAVATTCFGMSADEVERLEQSQVSPPEPPAETRACMIEAFGEEVALGMLTGQAYAVDQAVLAAGKEKMRACFERTFPTGGGISSTQTALPAAPPIGSTPQVWDTFERVTACTQAVLGDQYEPYTKGQYAPTTSELEKMRQCSDAQSGTSAVAPSVDSATSSQVRDTFERFKACQQTVLGSNYEAQKIGQYVPTEAEAAQLRSCSD